MAATLVLAEDIEIPMGIQSLADFRKWALSEAFPERGRFDYIGGRIEVDLSLRDLFCHGVLMTELVRVLGNRIHDQDLGHLFASRVRYSNPAADLSVQADMMFFSYDSIDSKRARLVPDPSGKPGRYVEIEGAIDLIIEIVDDATVARDTKRLPPAYFRAGVREFWLADARGDELQFQIHYRGEHEFQPVAVDEGGYQLSGVFQRRYRLNRHTHPRGYWRFDLQEADN